MRKREASASRGRGGKATRLDVARAAGVSLATASYALNNHPRVALQTRQRIIEAARRVGYVPDRAAQRLVRTRFAARSVNFDQIGLIYMPGCETTMDSVCLAMMKGAEQEFARLHATLAFVRVVESGDWEKVQRIIDSRGVDGWLLYGRVTDDAINRIKPAGLPHVILGDHRCAQPVYCANISNEAIGRMAVEHLASLGHRRIGYIGTTVRLVYQRRMLDAFRAAVREHGLVDDDRLIADNKDQLWRRPDGAAPVQWMRDAGRLPTALFAAEFGGGANMLRMLGEQRIDVPGSVSVLACEPATEGEDRVPVTRLELPLTEVGRHGAMLLHRIATDASIGPCEVAVLPTLVKNGTTGECTSKGI